MTFLKSTCKPARFRLTSTAVAIAAQLCVLSSVSAAEIETSSPDVKLRWDNTVKYSLGTRLKKQSDVLLVDYNADDGNRNFNKGLITNGVSLLSELDFSYQKKVGFRISGSAWYDQVYNQKTDNTFADKKNSNAAINEFPSETRKLHGKNAEFLDAFAFWNTELAAMPMSLRLGRHTVQYGETIFLGSNGIANAQGPVDLVKALGVPGSQLKEIMMPVNQLSANLQVNDRVSLGAYYQFEHRKTRLPGSGSFFDDASFFTPGGEYLYVGPFKVVRQADQNPKDSGQFGMQLKWRPESVDAEFGFYAARYHDKTLQSYVRLKPIILPTGPTAIPGTFQNVYHEGIRTYGVSMNKSVGDFNVGVEASIRDNAPLFNDAMVAPPGVTGILHPVGKTAHLNASSMVLLPKTAVWDGGVVIAELGWNRVTKITQNEAALAANSTKEGLAMRAVIEPSYYQVMPGLDLSVPIVIGYNFKGASAAVHRMIGSPARKGGDFSIGLKGTYNNDIRFALTYNRFLGQEGTVLDAANKVQFKSTLADRDNLTLTVQKTF